MTQDRIPKMPSMKHLPWSQEDARQQKWLNKTEAKNIFTGKTNPKGDYTNKIVITEKMDGANACITKDKVYARSHSGEPHREEWDYLKKKHREELSHKIGKDFAIFGEYLYARHSIKYENLPSYFLVFGVLYKGDWLAWRDVEQIAGEIGLPTVPVIDKFTVTNVDDLLEISDNFREYRTIVDNMPEGESKYGDTREGYVIRNREKFPVEQLTENMAKCVREDHVQTEELHWRKNGETETNKLKQNT